MLTSGDPNGWMRSWNCYDRLTLCDLSSVHTSNNIGATFDFVEATFDFVALTATMRIEFIVKFRPFNKFECYFDIIAVLATMYRSYHVISYFRQSRNKLNMFNLFRLCREDEISLNIVAKTGNIFAKNCNHVETIFEFVERIVRLIAFDNVASTLLLLWTGFRMQEPDYCQKPAPRSVN